MSTHDALGRLMAEWMAEAAPDTPDEEAFVPIITLTSRRRPRPRWLAFLKEPPMRKHSSLVVGSPTLRLATILALTIGLLVALTAAVIGAGASLAPSPAPSSDAMPPSFFTGTAPTTGACQIATPTFTAADGVVHKRGESWGCLTWMTDDPRFSGTSRDIWNTDEYTTGSHPATGRTGDIIAGRERIENADGAWAGAFTVLDVESFHQYAGWFEGEGAYAGLAAYVVITDAQGAANVWGMISPSGRLEAPAEIPAG